MDQPVDSVRPSFSHRILYILLYTVILLYTWYNILIVQFTKYSPREIGDLGVLQVLNGSRVLQK